VNKKCLIIGKGAYTATVLHTLLELGYSRDTIVCIGSDVLAQREDELVSYCARNSTFLGVFGEEAVELLKQFPFLKGIRFESIISSKAIISLTSNIGKACYIGDKAVLASGVVVHDFTFIGDQVVIGHDTIIHPFGLVEGKVCFGGHVELGFCSHIETGSTIIEDVILEEHCHVLAGSVVLSDASPHGVLGGIPAKKIN
jgi:acetyltransferase-like isoleucine patch superfamily enzyme